MDPQIIFEDAEVLVLDKPAGWITNEANTTTNQPVIQSWVKKELNYPISKNDEFRSGIVHRLDKETSGILLLAKTEKSFEDLQRQFKSREVKKTYTALSHGRLQTQTGEISAPLGRLPWRRDRFGVLPGGREATTLYKVVDYYKSIDKEYSLLDLKPKTGRTHQIRVHLKHLGHPIVADEFYAGRKTARADRKWCPRLFLHASEISFLHPENKKIVVFKSLLPKDLKLALGKLSGSADNS